MAMGKNLEIQNLKINTFGFNNQTILDIPYFNMENERELVISGASGSGKTTFLYAIAGLFLKLDGKVSWDRNNLYNLAPIERDRWRSQNLGIIFQNFQLLDELSVLDNILVPTGFDSFFCPKDMIYKAEKLADEFSISIHHSSIAHMSRGEKQRIALARALIKDAPIILADEPTASLDEDNARNILQHLRKISQETDKTLIIVSHDPVIMEQIDNKLVLEHGKIIANNLPNMSNLGAA